MAAELTNKQKKFCEEYVIDLNATRAAIRAGYYFHSTSGSKFFVYALLDPRNDSIFYIGKGCKNRPYDHLREAVSNSQSNVFKCKTINEILSSGYDVEIIYLAIELNEQDAFGIEHGFIKTIGTSNLTNISGGVRKESVKEWAKQMLSKILPFDVWSKSRPAATEYEKELYYQVVAECNKISIEGYVHEIEQTYRNGSVETKFKWRL